MKMSALGHKRTWECASGMSALPPKADILQGGVDVRYVPIADIEISMTAMIEGTSGLDCCYSANGAGGVAVKVARASALITAP